MSQGMIITISHRTRYEYDRPVQMEQQWVRLQPKADDVQDVRDFSLTADPLPSATRQAVDDEGNPVIVLEYEAPVDRLEIVTRATVATRPPPAAGALIWPGADRLPYLYTMELRHRLRRYLALAPTDPDVAAFVQPALESTGGSTLAFLEELVRRVQRQHAYETRHAGPPHPPAATLARRRGSCRDLALLYMACARHVGLAARFASGYHLRQESGEGDELHAWAEVFLPGAGWRGYDPTAGLAVDVRHVAVASAPEPTGAAPLTGTFRGNNVRSTLTAQVEVRRAPST